MTEIDDAAYRALLDAAEKASAIVVSLESLQSLEAYPVALRIEGTCWQAVIDAARDRVRRALEASHE